LQCYSLFNHQTQTLESLTAIWLLPAVSPIVSAASGGIVASYLSPQQARLTIVSVLASAYTSILHSKTGRLVYTMGNGFSCGLLAYGWLHSASINTSYASSTSYSFQLFAFGSLRTRYAPDSYIDFVDLAV